MKKITQITMLNPAGRIVTIFRLGGWRIMTISEQGPRSWKVVHSHRYADPFSWSWHSSIEEAMTRAALVLRRFEEEFGATL